MRVPILSGVVGECVPLNSVLSSSASNVAANDELPANSGCANREGAAPDRLLCRSLSGTWHRAALFCGVNETRRRLTGNRACAHL